MKYLFLFLTLFSFSIKSFSQITFEKIFDNNDSNNLIGSWVTTLPDGGYALLGKSNNNVVILRTDQQGNLQQRINVSFPFYVPYSFVSYGNYNYNFTGHDISYNTAFFTAVDSVGNVLFNNTDIQGSVGLTHGIGISHTIDNGILAMYWSDDEMGHNPTDIEKYNSQGTFQWSSEISNNCMAAGINAIRNTRDSSFLSIAPYEYNYYDSCCQYFVSKVRKLNKYGTPLWSKELGPIYKSLDTTSDQGCVVTNESFFTKVDSSGDSLWTKYFPFYFNTSFPDGVIIRQTYDHGYAICGTGTLPGNSSQSIILYRTDSLGDSLWIKTIDYCNSEWMGNFEITGDSGFIIAGTTASFGNSQKLIFVKLDSTGNIYTNPVMIAHTSTHLCGNDSCSFTAPCGYSYLWSTGDTTQQITTHLAGSYFVTLSDSGGNTFHSDTFIVTLNAFPIVSLGNDTTICSGQTVFLHAGNFDSYQWLDGSTDSTFIASTAGWYAVTVTDSNGCHGTDSLQVNVNPNPILNLGQDTSLCSGAALEFTMDSTFASYSWNTGDSTYSITINVGGTYWLRVTDSLGCSSVDTITIVENPLPSFTLGNDTSFCSDQLFILDPGSFVSYFWQDGSLDSEFTVSMSGSYAVNVTDSNGCSAADTILIQVNPLPNLSLGNDTTVCTSETLVLNAGAGYLTYLWQDSSTAQYFMAYDTTSMLADTLHYFVTITDSNQCMSTDSISIYFDFCSGLTNAGISSLKYFPNPANNQLNIDFSTMRIEYRTVSILDPLGFTLLSKTTPENVIAFNLDSFAEGIYILKIEDGFGVETKQFIILKK